MVAPTNSQPKLGRYSGEKGGDGRGVGWEEWAGGGGWIGEDAGRGIILRAIVGR